MNLKPASEIPEKTKVVLRLDTDLPIEDGLILSNERLVKSLATIQYLLKRECKLVVLGHLGRPQGKRVEELSLKPIYLELMSLLENADNMLESVFLEDVTDLEKIDTALGTNQIVFMENMRFWPEEEENDSDFLQGLTEVTQAFCNDAFSVAHRKHASLMLFKKLPGFYGFDFVKEADEMEKLLNQSHKPRLIILGGAKEDKLSYLTELKKWADKILIGGKLPKVIDSAEFNDNKVEIAELREDGLDLNSEDIEKFGIEIKKAGTIIWSGAMGKYEESNCQKGTEEIAKLVMNSSAYKVIGGGDTGASIEKLGLKEKIDFYCEGGGVLLEFLTKGRLPTWE